MGDQKVCKGGKGYGRHSGHPKVSTVVISVTCENVTLNNWAGIKGSHGIKVANQLILK